MSPRTKQGSRRWTLAIVSIGLFMVVLDNLVVNGAVSSGLPEPTSVALFGIGAVVTSVYGWRRRVGK